MRFGQTSFVAFVSQVAASVIGFGATVYITRSLGPEIFGTYALIVAVVIWVKTGAIMGIRSAVTKRISESGETHSYITAGWFTIIGILGVVSISILLFQGFIDSYIGYPSSIFILGLTFSATVFAFVKGVLQGQHRVHIAALLEPVDRTARSIIQIGLIFLGLGLSGILVGYGVAAMIAAGIGLIFTSFRFSKPSKQHFRHLFSFAKYSWLSRLSSRTFTSMDTVILGVFVAVGYIGIYEVSWNLASILAVFGTAIGQVLFPEISKYASQDQFDEAVSLLESSLAYAGFLLIPGLIGSLAIGDMILAIYGPEFTEGHYILVLLVLSRLIYSYADQIVTTLNGLDRPRLSFRINAAFIFTNLLLNIILIWWIGWIGAAIATTMSAAVSLSLSWKNISKVLPGVGIPKTEIGYQVISGIFMGLSVFGFRLLFPNTIVVGVGLAILGAISYFSMVYLLSEEFRATLRSNLPGFF